MVFACTNRLQETMARGIPAISRNSESGGAFQPRVLLPCQCCRDMAMALLQPYLHHLHRHDHQHRRGRLLPHLRFPCCRSFPPPPAASGLLPPASNLKKIWTNRRPISPRRSLLGALLFTMAGSCHASARANTSEAEQILKNVEWPERFPFKEEDFRRFDESPDTIFYGSPRFVTHIDDPAIRALTKYYDSVFPPSNTPGVALLDMCSSWISHYPKGYKQERIAGMGLNEDELKRNPVLTEYVVQDLNVNTILPYEDNSFDIITNAVSVDYLAKPLEVFKEMRRVLKPGGLAAMSFSNRCFWTKAISIWTGTGDVDHVYIVGSYFHYAGGFEPPQALDISPNPGRTDPMYVVFSRKLPN